MRSGCRWNSVAASLQDDPRQVEDDLVDVIRREICVLQRGDSGGGSHRHRGFVGTGVTASLDACPLGDPFVTGVEQAGPVVVGHDVLWCVSPEPENVSHPQRLERG